MTTKAKPKAKKQPSAPKAESSICFVIMPFGGWFDDYYETVYKAAIEAAGMEPHRADDLYRPSTIVNDIWDYTQKAKIILADLSGKNPNVFYELGLAHALAKPAILITESIEDIPFDLRALRVLDYNKNAPMWGELLGEKITKALKEILGSPMQSVLPAFLSVKMDAKPRTVTETDKQILEMKQEIELLRNEVYRPNRRRSSEIDPQEAEQLIKAYLRKGLPDPAIVARLTDMGAPASWVERKIDELGGKYRQQELVMGTQSSES